METTDQRQCILFVDDEPNVLNGLRRMLRHKRSVWKMFFAQNVEIALDTLRDEAVDVVVSDIRMPGTDGRQFLKIVRTQYPDAVRIILSGQAEREVLLRSVNLAHQYLVKPCSPEMLQSTLEKVVDLRNVLQKNELRRMIGGTENLPSIPAAYAQLMDELRLPNASTKRVGQIIAHDMSMTARILRVANSAFFGLATHIADPEHAVRLLGLETIKTMVLSARIFEQFQDSTHSVFMQELWQHSVAVAAFAQTIAHLENCDQEIVHDALMAGMLHDLGKLLMISKFGAKASDFIVSTEASINGFTDFEKDCFGATHAEAGAYLLGLWGFNYSIVEAVAFHHLTTQDIAGELSLLTIVHIANRFEHACHGDASVEEQTATALKGLPDTERVRHWWSRCNAMARKPGKKKPVFEDSQPMLSNADHQTEANRRSPGGIGR